MWPGTIAGVIGLALVVSGVIVRHRRYRGSWRVTVVVDRNREIGDDPGNGREPD